MTLHTLFEVYCKQTFVVNGQGCYRLRLGLTLKTWFSMTLSPAPPLMPGLATQNNTTTPLQCRFVEIKIFHRYLEQPEITSLGIAKSKSRKTVQKFCGFVRRS